MGLPDRINDEEEKEILDKEGCTVAVDEEGNVILKCDLPKAKLSPQDVQLIAGISEIVEKKKREEK